MEYSFWEQVANIPWIVYALFIVIIRSTYRLTKPSIIPVRLMSIALTILILLTISGILLASNNTPAILLTCSFGLTLGIVSGWKQYKHQQVKAITGQKRLYMPGSYSALVMLGVLISMQLLCYIVRLNKPEWQNELLFSLSWYLIYSFFSGLFIGRLAYASRCLKKGPFIDETEATLNLKSPA